MVSLLLYDSNEHFLLLSNKLKLPPQVGVHARACQRYTGGQDAGCVTKPQGVGVTSLAGLHVSMDRSVRTDQQHLTPSLPK